MQFRKLFIDSLIGLKKETIVILGNYVISSMVQVDVKLAILRA